MGRAIPRRLRRFCRPRAVPASSLRQMRDRTGSLIRSLSVPFPADQCRSCAPGSIGRTCVQVTRARGVERNRGAERYPGTHHFIRRCLRSGHQISYPVLLPSSSSMTHMPIGTNCLSEPKFALRSG